MTNETDKDGEAWEWSFTGHGAMPGMLVIESAANTVMVRVAKIEALERDGTQVSLHTVSGCHAFRFDRGEKAAAFVMAIVERLRAVERAEVEA